MRYRDFIDYSKEPRAERLARLALMYGVDESDDHAQDAETALTCAKANKLRVDALLAVAKAEGEP